MELTLWRWSLGVQVSSTLLVTAFFVALQRSLPRGSITAWVRGWALNLAALGVAFGSWMTDPPPSVQPLALFLFLAPKTLAVLYLAQGAWSLAHPGRQFIGWPQFLVAGFLYPVFAGWVLTKFDLIGAGQQLFVALMFLPTGLALIRSGDRALHWLAGGFLARGLLCLLESAAYAVQVLPEGVVSAAHRAQTGLFLAVHSSFDSGTEWLLALGFVLALSLRSQRALEASISGLHQAQEELRRLVDYDPLTALLNRRALPEILRAVQPDGATVLFMDLDDFKQVNDERGHEVGDSSLRRFAAALRESFRPDDSFVRYGGDEFVVVARGLSRDLAEERVATLRARLAMAAADGPALRVSVGIAELAAGGRPEDALRAADQAMYSAKQSRVA
ncbi:MAG: GGDEF domain-containing protein [Vicinamibacteria bacterium]|nr:GGDEF domain-containing protein [Vicinamibacteria bacterium]